MGFLTSKFSGYLSIILLAFVIGGAWYMYQRGVTFGEMEIRAEEQAKTIASKQQVIAELIESDKAKQEALQRQADRSQILTQQAGLLRQKLKEASDAATKALKSCLDMRIADGMHFGPSSETEVVKAKPDPTWMADCEIPLRNGETLGSYYNWSFELWQSLRRCNERQAAEREFYAE